MNRRAFLIGGSAAFGAFAFRPISRHHRRPPRTTTTTRPATTTTSTTRPTTTTTSTPSGAVYPSAYRSTY